MHLVLEMMNIFLTFMDLRMYVVKVNDKHFLTNRHLDSERIMTFSTEKKALKQLEHFKKISEYSNFDFKVLKWKKRYLFILKKVYTDRR
jgi:hypothetical protein